MAHHIRPRQRPPKQAAESPWKKGSNRLSALPGLQYYAASHLSSAHKLRRDCPPAWHHIRACAILSANDLQNKACGQPPPPPSKTFFLAGKGGCSRLTGPMGDSLPPIRRANARADPAAASHTDLTCEVGRGHHALLMRLSAIAASPKLFHARTGIRVLSVHWLQVKSVGFNNQCWP